MPDEISLPVSRRIFLRRIAMAGAVILIPSTVAIIRSAPSASTVPPAKNLAAIAQPLRIGLLLPQSQIYPQLGQRVLQGFQMAFDQQNANGEQVDNTVAIVPVDYGTSPTLALSHASELVVRRKVDVLSGLFSRNHAMSLAPLLSKHQIPLLVSDMGANVIGASNQSAYIIRNSLGFWQSSLALGRWAAQQLGQRAVIATSFYESGYDTLHAFRSGFEYSGGTILATLVSDGPYNGFATPSEMIAQIAALCPDVVYAAYSGQSAVAFVRAYAESALHQQVPLIGTGMLIDEQLLPEMGAAALGIRSAFTWAPSLANTQNQAFMAAFAIHTGHPPDAFALLGYDSGQLIRAAHQQSGLPDDRTRLLDAMRNASIASPRGALTIDSAYLESNSPIYLREVRRFGDSFTNQITAQLDPVPARDPYVMALRDTQRSGWTNAYLCV